MENEKEWEKPKITILFDSDVQDHVMAVHVSGEPTNPPPPPPP